MRSTSKRSARGASLVEVLVALAVMALVIGSVGLTAKSSSSAFGQAATAAEVESKARRLVERIAGELIMADRSSLVFSPPAPFPASSVEYARVEGYAGGNLILGPTRAIRLVHVDNELDDGLDNDSNGLVDESRIELVPDVAGAPGQAIRWGNFVREHLAGEVPDGNDDNGNGLVDERGLCLTFTPATNTLMIRLTLERVGPGGRLISSTVETAVLIRND